MSKPEIGSKWRTLHQCNGFERGFEFTVASEDRGLVLATDGGGWNLDRFVNGDLERIDPAPAEPAKAAGWVPKVGERVVMSGTVSTVGNDSGQWNTTVDFDGPMGGMAIALGSLRPEAAPPAAAPDGIDHVAKAVVERHLIIELGKSMAGFNRSGHNFNDYLEEAIRRVRPGTFLAEDERSLRMQLADARGQRDKFEALSVKRELELGDKEREIARLESRLREATDRLRRRGERL